MGNSEKANKLAILAELSVGLGSFFLFSLVEFLPRNIRQQVTLSVSARILLHDDYPRKCPFRYVLRFSVASNGIDIPTRRNGHFENVKADCLHRRPRS